MRVSRFIEAEIESKRLPGAVLGIVRGDRLVGLDAFGFRDPVAGVPGVVFMAHASSRIQARYQQHIKALVTQALG